jgi:uncharacterized membrane protein YjjP (DUF1212 family)
LDTPRHSVPLQLLAQAGRLLLEYSESTGEIHRALASCAKSLSNDACEVIVSYNGVAVSLGAHGPLIMPVRELRLNMAVQAAVHSILDRACRGRLDATTALAELEQVEATAPRLPRLLVIFMLGVAAASLAVILGADRAAALVAGVATGLGLAVRQELGRRHFSLLTMPFAGALLGALLGGIAIRLDWTDTPGLILIVPSLILVPGPHFINGLLDAFDNFLLMAVSRLTLATGIVIAAALGIIVGVRVILSEFPPAAQPDADRLNLARDMVLAGIVTCGFAAAYNTRWPHLAQAAVGGMFGHGLRYVALAAGWQLDAATLLGGMGVGVIAALISRSTKAPFAAIAFAGAVTMMPGLSIYRALGGAVQLARRPELKRDDILAATLGEGCEAFMVVGGLVLGLVVASRTVRLLAED